MASMKLLGEILQEEQDPFILQAYLLERGYSSNKIPSSLTNKTWQLVPRVIRRLFGNQSQSKLIKTDSLSSSSCCDHDENVIIRNKESGNGFSFESCTKVNFNEPEDQVDTGRRDDYNQSFNCVQTKTARESNAITRDQTTSHVVPCPTTQKFTKNPEEDHHQRAVHINRDLVFGDMRDQRQFAIAKKALLQSKHLLFNCVREIVLKQRVRKKGIIIGRERILGAEEMGNLLCKSVRKWSSLCENEANIDRILEFDFSESVGEYSSDGFHVETTRIAANIAHSILDDFTYDIVVNMTILW